MIDTSYQIKVGGGSIVNTISTPLWTPFLPFGDWSQWWTREPCWPFFLSTVQIDLVYANKHRSHTKFRYMHLLMGKTVLHKKSLVHSINFLNPIKNEQLLTFGKNINAEYIESNSEIQKVFNPSTKLNYVSFVTINNPKDFLEKYNEEKTAKCSIYKNRPQACSDYNCFEHANKLKRRPQNFVRIQKLIKEVHGIDVEWENELKSVSYKDKIERLIKTKEIF